MRLDDFVIPPALQSDTSISVDNYVKQVLKWNLTGEIDSKSNKRSGRRPSSSTAAISIRVIDEFLDFPFIDDDVIRKELGAGSLSLSWNEICRKIQNYHYESLWEFSCDISYMLNCFRRVNIETSSVSILCMYYYNHLFVFASVMSYRLGEIANYWQQYVKR
jgi:hypothetical protein